MPGFELIGNEERAALNNIFDESNGVLFAHGFIPLRNGRYRVREFEANFSTKLDVPYAQAVTSGTIAQYVAMLGMGIRPGDEVITQSFTFVATIEAILAIGAVPVIVDIDDTYNMNPIALEQAITKKTKLIVPVHMLGNTADMDGIIKVANQYNIPVLEDACEALGARYHGRYAGTIAEAGFYSLDFAKTITTGEGGMIVTSSPAIYQHAREFHDHGHESNPNFPRGKDTRTIPGLNFRMTEMQGAVGLAQLEKLDSIVQLNQRNKAILKEMLSQSQTIQFRKITDSEGELADTLIFNFEDKAVCDKFVEKYVATGFHTKNVPDAMDWHFSGTWHHMFKNVPQYKETWKNAWDTSAKLLARSVAIPIYVKKTMDEMQAHGDAILTILRAL